MLNLLSFSDSWYHNSLSVYYTLFGGSPTSWFMNNFAFSEIMRALKESNVLYRIWNTTQFIRVKPPSIYIIFKNSSHLKGCFVVRHKSLVHIFRIIHDCMVCPNLHTHIKYRDE